MSAQVCNGYFQAGATAPRAAARGHKASLLAGVASQRAGAGHRAAAVPQRQHLAAAASPRRQQQGAGRRGLVCQAAQAESPSVPDGSVTLVLLAGGVGKRMGAPIPKQYLQLRGQEIATYSLQTFAAMPQVGEVVVVCEPEWREVFERCYAALPRQPPLHWAAPGKERQDSVLSGLRRASHSAVLVAVHDSARPLVTAADAARCFEDAWKVGAAVLGVQVKPTIKEVDAEGRVVCTLQRAKLWEVQTPQVIRPQLLLEGFELVAREKLEVTDDVSIVEAMGLPVQVTPGAYTNIKVTTPEDMFVAEKFLEEAEQQQRAAAAAVPATA